ncbi:hypothetical protein GF325_09275, partial [Candidatus Bathyarchaeota archaeon]|nr:hypothetical protein [Candidatus Bathyarchaeota archaeon]
MKSLARLKGKFHLSMVELPLVTSIFISWFLLFVDAYPLAQDLDHSDTISIDSTLEYFLLGMLLFSVVAVFLKSKLHIIACITCLSTWCVFFVSWMQFNATAIVDPVNTPEINLGLFMIDHFWIFVFTGMASTFYLYSVVHQHFERIGRSGQSAAPMLAITGLAIFLLGWSHRWLISLDLEFALLLSFFPLLIVLAWNGRDQEPIIGHKNAFFGVLFFGAFFISMVSTFWIGTAPLFYFAVDRFVMIFSGGFLTTIAIVELVKRFLEKPMPYYLLLLVALAIQVIELLLIFTRTKSSDSTYDTGPATPFVFFLVGATSGMLVQAACNAYSHFKLETRENRRIWHEMGRWFLSAVIVGGFYFGIMQGLDEKAFKKNINEYAFFGAITLLGVIATYTVLVYIGIKKKNKPRLFVVKRQTARLTSRKFHVSRKKIFSFIACSTVVGSTCLALIPHAVYPSTSTSGYPIYLGNIGKIAVSEVSPLSKVGKFDLIPAGKAASLGNPVIRRSMARNEFETVQVVLSNWGFSKVMVKDITISNSTHGGYNTTFSLDPVNKSWKNETWAWRRFTARYVDEIQPGCPNILYDFHGNQTKVQLVTGKNESRPVPNAAPGTNLALWFTLYTSNDTSTGMYSDEVSIVTSKGTINVTLETMVWDFTLPVNHSLRVAFGNRNLDRIDNRDDWIKNYLKHRVSPYFPFMRGSYYTKNTEHDNVTFDFAQLEIDLTNAIDHGQDHFRIQFKPGDVYGAGAFSQSFNDTAISYYSQLGSFLASHPLPGGGTWLDLAIVYAIDEPSEDEYDGFNRWSELVHSAHPGWNVLLTEQYETPLDGMVDIWCPHINSVNPENIPLRHLQGEEFWYYTCCSLVNKPTVSFVDPSVDHLALFWCAYAFDFDGFLFW